VGKWEWEVCEIVGERVGEWEGVKKKRKKIEAHHKEFCIF
jgi:hypothetical protein